MIESTISRFYIPELRKLYSQLDVPAETILRVVAGVALIIHGSSKIMDPFGSVGMVERLGFYPGLFWSPFLAVTEFFGGIFLTIGFLTRPAALATMIVLLVTVWFHWITAGQGYAGAEKPTLGGPPLFFFAPRGGNRHSVDARIGRPF